MKAMTPETIALEATILLHADLLSNDGFAGYDGTKEAFDSLYEELLAIANERGVLLFISENPVDSVTDTFYEYHEAICQGEREVDWYM